MADRLTAINTGIYARHVWRDSDAGNDDPQLSKLILDEEMERVVIETLKSLRQQGFNEEEISAAMKYLGRGDTETLPNAETLTDVIEAVKHLRPRIAETMLSVSNSLVFRGNSKTLSGVIEGVKSLRQRFDSGALAQFTPELLEGIGRDLTSAETFIADCQRAIREGDTLSAVGAAVVLGGMVERLGVRMGSELHAARGRKTLNAAKAGHAKVHGTAVAKDNRRAAVLRSWNHTRSEHPGWAATAVDAHVAKQFKLSDRTVRNYRKTKM